MPPVLGADNAYGLTEEEAARRLERHGPNTIPEPARFGVTHRVLHQLSDPMLLLLLGAAGLTIWQGDAADTAVIALVVVLNTAVGVAQELRAEQAVAALRQLASPTARVVRGGITRTVLAAELVPGDHIVLEAGDVVPADAEIAESHQLVADESALTGESLGVDKHVAQTVRAGTTLTRGRGRAQVTETGVDSALGTVAALVASARPGPTPLQRRLNHLGRQLTVAALTAAAVVMGLSLVRGLGWSDAALQGASLAVAAVPESLPAVLTLSLALGARRMARHHAIARELRAVETLGSVTLLATDKTGTLTENRMVVVAAWTPDGEHTVTGAGYSPAGTVIPGTRAPAGEALTRLARDVVLCSDAELELRDGTWLPLGDPTEAALVAFAGRAGLDAATVRAAAPRRAEVPFDSDRGWMLTAHTIPDATGLLAVVKGGPARVLAAAGSVDEVDRCRAWCRSQADAGRRVLAVLESADPYHGGDVLPARLSLVGAVAMTDPPRAGVASVVEALAAAGIRLAVMTGDHPATAAMVARQVGLTGDVVDVGDGDGIAAAQRGGAAIYARVRPDHKLALVRRWQADGEVVAVTGDGVNDGPALRRADIGVAMGLGGTEVARQAADLVLTDDRLETVVHAVEEGRRIHDNLRRFLGYALSGGTAEVAFVLLAPFFGFLVPLLPGQILWVNMLTHGLPGVAMGAEPAAPDVLRRVPLAPDTPVLDQSLLRRIGLTGAVITVVTLLAALLTRHAGSDGRTAAFLVLGLAQIGVALASRDPGAARRNTFLTVASAVAAGLMVTAVLVPPLRELLQTEPLPIAQWVVCAVLATVPGGLLRAVRARRPGT